MNKLDGREKIIAIIGAVPDKYQGMIVESDKATSKKVDKIGKILNKNPELFQDETVARKVIQFTEPKKEDARIGRFREEFIFGACCHVEDGIIHITRNNLVTNEELSAAIISCGGGLAREGFLRISEHDLKNFENFWDFIQEYGLKTLEITTEDNKKISYTEATLDQLLDKKPSIGDLTEIYTIKFGLGESTALPKAKLTLCGEVLELMVRSGMQESVSKVIKLKKRITTQGFFEILDQVETGKVPAKLSKAYLQAVRFLQFEMRPLLSKLPEGFYGAEALAKYGFRDIPPPSQDCINFWNANCKSTTHMAVYVPPTSLDEMNERAQKTDAEYKTKLFISPYTDVQKLRPQKVEKGYWLILETDIKELNGNEEAHRATCPDGYELPLALDVVMCNLLLYVTTGKCLFGRNPYRYVRCHEKVGKSWNAVVGGFAPVELFVSGNDVYGNLGVVRARKFR